MKAKHRKTKGGEEYIYYILCGSWRDSQGLTMRDELLHVGRRDDFDVWEMREVADIVTDRANGEPESAFYEQEHSQKVRMMADSVYSQLIALGKIDIPGRNRPGESDLERCRREHERQFIGDVSTAKHTWSLQIGAEHLCYETMRKLRLSEALGSLGFNNEEVSLALTQIAIRAIHPASEYAIAQWIKPHSDICRLTGYNVDKITKDRLYRSAIHLYDVREGLMKHLSRWTKEFFGFKEKEDQMTIDTTNMCSHLQKKLFEEDGIYHPLWLAMQDDAELTAVVRSRQLHIYRNGKKILVLAGKAAPKIIREDKLCEMLQQ